MKIQDIFWLTLLVMLFLVDPIMGQQSQQVSGNKVTITVKSNNRTRHAGEDFFVTGSFNNWKPADVLVGKMPGFGDSVQVHLHDIPKGLLELKFTRGNWETLACTAKGNLEGPIKIMVSNDTAITTQIDGWRDDFPASTASKQVHLMDSAFYFPKLDVHRRVWIYLPEDYNNSTERYPVLYMHDGQDLFDEATSKGRIGPLEWRVDEAIDEARQKAMVVAVAHAEDIQRRQEEYFVRPTTRFPEPLGEAYLSDIVQVLKPFIDTHYRTKTDRKHTAMVGSSVGGLLTFYAGLLHPETFGTLGVLSPSIWLDEGNVDLAIADIKVAREADVPAFYLYGGGNENRVKPDGSRVQMHEDIVRINTMMQQSGREDIKIAIEPDGRHGAWYWQKAFPLFYSWWSNQWAVE